MMITLDFDPSHPALLLTFALHQDGKINMLRRGFRQHVASLQNAQLSLLSSSQYYASKVSLEADIKATFARKEKNTVNSPVKACQKIRSAPACVVLIGARLSGSV